jgi:4a-hydroxytetrahydrobiopterin dehydratase
MDAIAAATFSPSSPTSRLQQQQRRQSSSSFSPSTPSSASRHQQQHQQQPYILPFPQDSQLAREFFPLVRGAGADGRWALTEAKTAVERTYKFKTFAKAWVSWADEGGKIHARQASQQAGC